MLAFLIYRGVVASQDREMTLRQIAIIPAVMLALSLQDIAAKFGLGGLSVATWLAGATIGAALTWLVSGKSRATPGSAPGTVIQAGSWTPLALMMAIFFTKYTVAVALSLHPELARSVAFSAGVCALFGIFNGIFFGRMLRPLNAFMTARTTAIA
ncbi:hypothetical protein HSX11_18035 [Oxalobacteraceae bacterium]|nr:hypothetical protein [Oxalobacteraceae bacterium]